MNKLITLTFLISAIFLGGCEKHVKKPVLKVGIWSWPGFEPLALAAEKGFYQGGTHIRVIRFSTPIETSRALRNGLVDVAAFTVDEVFNYAEVRNAPKIFMVLDISNGADAIVAKKSIKSLEDLKGKTLATEGSALGHYMINRSLEFANNLKLSDIKLTTVQACDQAEAFKKGLIDAAVTYEPSKSLLISQGAHVLFDSSQIQNEIIDVLVTNNETIKTRAKDLKVLVDGWFRALDYINKNPTIAMKELASVQESTVENITHSFTQIKIPSREENIKMLSKNGLLIEPMEKLSRLMYKQGSLQKEIDVEPLINFKILEILEK